MRAGLRGARGRRGRSEPACSKTPHLPCFGHFGVRKHRTCRALATLALDCAGPASSKTPHLPCFGHLGARKHRTCHALATWALENTAPAVLWPRGRSTGRGLLARKHRTCRALATWALEWAARAPARCPQSARRGCSIPPLGAPRALEGAARAPARCPQGARSGCSSLLSAPGCSKWLLKLLLGTPCALRAAFRAPARCCRGPSSYLLYHCALEKAFENAARRVQRTLYIELCVTYLCYTLRFLLGHRSFGPGSFGTLLRTPARNHRDIRACFYATGVRRGVQRSCSKKRLSCTELSDPSLFSTLHCAWICTGPH